ncbi:MAG: hypothetical protein RJQ04_03290 [Longimicrobiales bacterium]
MSTRLQVVMDESELAEIQDAAERARLTVSEWVRLVLREARGVTSPGAVRPAPSGSIAPSDAEAAVRETTPGYGSAARGRASRSPVLVDDELLHRVMERYRFPTRDAAVYFALQRAADPPMTREELLDMRGSGWEGDLDALRASDPPPSVP